MDDETVAKSFPEFPSVEGEPSSLRIQRDWSARAWSGTGTRLVQLQKEVHRSLRKLYESKIVELSDDSGGQDAAEELLKSLRVRVNATGHGGKMTRSGELAAILGETDPADIESLTISNSSQSKTGHISLVFNRDGVQDSLGVVLKVSGHDRSWVGGTAEVISTEVAKGVPSWSPLRHGFASFVFCFLTACGVLSFLVSNSNLDATLLSVPLLSLVIALPAALGVHWLVNKILPGFEVLEPGSSNSGKRLVMGVIAGAGLVLSFVSVIQGFIAQ